MSEIETEAKREGFELGAQLEELRTSERIALHISQKLSDIKSERFGFSNYLKKYCETDSDGLYTGNFISDVNYGQYTKDFKLYKQELRKKYNYQKNSVTGEYEAPNEDSWLHYNMDIIAWMGNGHLVFNDDTKLYEFVKNPNSNPRAHMRYVPQYYIDRLQILGKDAYEENSAISTSIQEIYSLCMENIEYEVIEDGKTVKKTKRIPVIHNLPEGTINRLNELLNKKQQLSNPYWVHYNIETGQIENLTEKIGSVKERADRFAKWQEYKAKYRPKTEQTKSLVFESIKKQLQDKIDNLTSQLSNMQQTDENYENVKNQLIDATDKLNKFIRYNTEVRVNPVLYEALGEKTPINYDLSNEKTERYLSLRRQRSSIYKMVTVNTKKGLKRDLTKISLPVFMQLREIDQEISDLAKELKIFEKTEDDESDEVGYYKWSDIFEKDWVKLIKNGKETNSKLAGIIDYCADGIIIIDEKGQRRPLYGVDQVDGQEALL